MHLRSDSPQAGIEGGTEQIIESRVSYNQYGQIAWIETPEGEVTHYFYYPANDPDGDGQNIITGNDHSGRPISTITGGYLREVIADFSHTSRYRGTAAPVQVSNSFGYDRAGNTIWRRDGRGVRTDFAVNQLNQVVQITMASDMSQATEPNLTAYSYRSRIYYDHNDNVVRVEGEYRDGNNPDLPEFLDTYDILDNLVETTSRVSDTETITSHSRYDANENMIERISPLAVAGIESGNRVQVIYDERDLVYQVIGAPGTAEETRLTSSYDLNGNLVESRDGEDNNGDGEGDATTFVYDGFDRLIATIDAAGNELRLSYDPVGNAIGSEL